jgi:putative transcriptional regulator
MTQTIRHHLSDALLTGYATGHLAEAISLVAASHISLCDECRARLASLEALGGALVDSGDELAMAEDALDRVLARLAPPDRRTAPLRAGRTVLPQPLRDYVGGDVEAVKWKSLGGGVRQAILRAGPRATARLLYIPAGQAVPDHGHRGLELTLVLQGAFRDEVDRFGPGDLEIATEDLEHQPVAEDGEACICLAVTDAPLRFTGVLPRLLQPIFRI